MPQRFLPSIAVLFFLCFVVPFVAKAAGWASVSSPTNKALYDFGFSGSSTGYAVGAEGTVLKTTDGGKTWKKPSGEPGSGDFFAVSLLDSKTVLAAGQKGILIKTTDGGSTWQRLETGTEKNLYDLRMITSSTGFVVGEGGLILKTTDGGKTWKQKPSGTSADLLDVSVPGSNTSAAWIAGANGILLKTADGGSTWSMLPSGTAQDIPSLQMISQSEGWAGVSDGTLLKTSDGGKTWKSIRILDWKASDLTDLAFLSFGNGLVSGSDGTLFETTDSGATWLQSSLPGSSILQILSFRSSDTRFGAGEGGTIIRYDAHPPSAPSHVRLDDKGTVTNDPTPTIQWDEASDDETSVASYQVRFDNGSYRSAGSSLIFIPNEPLKPGDHVVGVRAIDAGGNAGSETKLSFTVTGSALPVVGLISPTSAIIGSSITLSAEVWDDQDVLNCTLYVDDVRKQSMTVSNGYASTSFSFPNVGTFPVHASCVDSEGNRVDGLDAPVTILPVSSDVRPADLVKIGCGAGATADDPCKAVYYYGADGKRHAFPNERIFKTWFADFKKVVSVSKEVMASLPLGPNVTYRPGKKLVKFPSDPTVYAVSRGGVLRAIANEEIAAALYGPAWAAEVDDLPEAFFGNYRLGPSVDSSRNYDKSTVLRQTEKIDQNW